MEMANKSWSGKSMEDLYENNDPYSFSITPVALSKHHAVLYELPVTLVTPPKSHRNTQINYWDRNHVNLPYSPQNLFPVKNENGEEMLKSRWEIIENVLLQPINSSRELEAKINCYNTRLLPFSALHYFFEEVLVEEEAEVFFKTLLPGIIRLALQLPEILPGNLPLLQKENCMSISLSQLQIASLLANGFLCTFPWKKEVSKTYPGANFARLFAAHQRPKRVNCVTEKIKAICHYFRRVLSQVPIGTVTFERKFLQRNQFPRWDRLDNNLGDTKIHLCSTGTIENNGHGLLQVDFANKFVGGGVLGYGCVQEEIRYIICPELIISRLFTEELGPCEALVITGVERYSDYSGYGDTFVWEGNYIDQTPHDCYGRRKTSVVAIDATKFNRPSDQFNTSLILRELNKAYVGFHSNSAGKLAPVATGNWGCGAFKGDANLKSLIQLMACSAAKRNMVYYTFGDTDLEKSIYEVYTFLFNNKIKVCELWRILCRFVVSNIKANNFVSYIQKAYFDLHTQPSINKFFGETNSKSNSSKGEASTSFKTGSKMSETWPIKYTKLTVTKKNSKPTTSTSAGNLLRNTQIESVGNKDRDNCRKDRKSDREDVIDLIKVIDGDTDDRNKNEVEESLLSSIDKYCENRDKSERNNTSNVQVKSDTVCVDMEVDEKKCDERKVGSKQKITDYFVKYAK